MKTKLQEIYEELKKELHRDPEAREVSEALIFKIRSEYESIYNHRKPRESSDRGSEGNQTRH